MLKHRSSAARQYPPLLALVLVVFLALAVLPSALNLPQSSPSTTLEYAPVPPADKNPNTPPGGNLSSLGLATSGSLTSGTEPGGEGVGVGGSLVGIGKNPKAKNCVGRPPRQTEDKLSPPCVAYFQGDNFGPTYQGVTRDEVRLLVYQDGGFCPVSSSGAQCDPTHTYFDLAKPAPSNAADEPVLVRMLRPLQRFFNDRYQTYNRFVHFYVYFGDADSGTPEGRRADASDNFEKVQPFAVITKTDAYGFDDEYTAAMAKRGVMNFGAINGKDESFFRTYPKLLWGLLPSVQQQAKQFSSFLCTQVVPYKTSFSGNDGENGKPRRLGLLRTNNAAYAGFQKFAKIVKDDVQACGGNVVAEESFHAVGYAVTSYERDETTVATQNMASFKEKGVTTVVWAQGYDAQHTKAAAAINYRPEWVLAGDQSLDGFEPNTYQDQTVFAHAWVQTPVTLDPPLDDQPCVRAMREADPNVNQSDAEYACTYGNFYVNMRQLFNGIQVAGPRLTPAAIDQGFHAIPSVESKDPGVPACFYEPNDYTCIKDGEAMWWDAQATNADSTVGCWRAAERGRRHFAGSWPQSDVLVQQRPDDPCNGYPGTYIV